MKDPKTIFLVLLLFSLPAGGAKKAALITEGFVFAGVDGKVTEGEKNAWFFQPFSNLRDEKGQVFAAMRLELLPSAVLEKITADVKGRASADYKLWARVTKYHDRNFLFVSYFLALSKSIQPEAVSEAQPPKKSEQPRPTINEPDDELAMPKEILERISTKRAARTSREGPAETKKAQQQDRPATDIILADRIGFIVKQSDGGTMFVLDALGRGTSRRTVELLPCEFLQAAEQTLAGELEPVRFRVAGIVTRYKGADYLLLQRAIRVYDYGNFGK